MRKFIVIGLPIGILLIMITLALFVYLQKDSISKENLEVLLGITLPQGEFQYAKCEFQYGILEQAMGDEILIVHEHIKFQATEDEFHDIVKMLGLEKGGELSWQAYLSVSNTSTCRLYWWNLENYQFVYQLPPQYIDNVPVERTDYFLFAIYSGQNIFLYREKQIPSH